MTPQEHYAAAEELLEKVADMAGGNADSDRFQSERTHLVALAQAHATLATVSRTS